MRWIWSFTSFVFLVACLQFSTLPVPALAIFTDHDKLPPLTIIWANVFAKYSGMNFPEFFSIATQGQQPYPWQQLLATRSVMPQLLSIPTGVGKTAAVVLSWLYRRFADTPFHHSTPLRLVYCLPMRTLVEQTHRACQIWLERLQLTDRVPLQVLMGGEDDGAWDHYPDRECLLIGTQDMLLSRALNRGYAMSRYRWPVHFGLLNNDCLWILDETQLMGVGLTTSAQLHGLRRKLGTCGPSQTLWMSATLDHRALLTVDNPAPADGFTTLTLTEADRQTPAVQQRLTAPRPLQRCPVVLSPENEKKGYAIDLAAWLATTHRPGTLTLVVVNRVARAQEIYTALQTLSKPKTKPAPLEAELGLIHSRFRPTDRAAQHAKLLSEQLPAAGRIIVATQAIEAGVDVSATLLVTELAPWPSLVQRFGRCNRAGDQPSAQTFWIDILPKDDKAASPYTLSELNETRPAIETLHDAGLQALAAISWSPPLPVVHTLRRKDLLDLWDTTPDLAGNDLDISRYIRETDDADVQIFYRDVPEPLPADLEIPAPDRTELCAVPVHRVRDFLTAHRKKDARAQGLVWRPLQTQWMPIQPTELRPGMVVLLTPGLGGYSPETGWTGDPKDKPTVHPVQSGIPPESPADSTNLCASSWVTLTQHLDDVRTAMTELQVRLSDRLPDVPWQALLAAALWHDVGKAHPAFQNMLRRQSRQAPDAAELYAKSAGRTSSRPRYFAAPDNTDERPGFRHELASALGWLQHNPHVDHASLTAFLIAAHHGKVRGSLRSLPDEKPPADPSRRFARGIVDGDTLPAVQLDTHTRLPPTVLDLSLMELGAVTHAGPSWLARVIALRDAPDLGPFRLSFCETLLRIADWHASSTEGTPDVQ